MAKVLIACEFSGTVRDAFIREGHDAISVDLLPSESDFGPHHQGDVIQFMDDHPGEFDLIIAHPTCTYLTNAGVRWIYVGGDGNTIDQERWRNMEDGAVFFNQFKGRADHVAIENPIPHGFARNLIGEYTQKIQPWEYGHGDTKATCLWLENLQPLVPTDIVSGRRPWVHHLPPSPDRWKERSRTYPGIAAAMAKQWGPLL